MVESSEGFHGEKVAFSLYIYNPSEMPIDELIRKHTYWGWSDLCLCFPSRFSETVWISSICPFVLTWWVTPLESPARQLPSADSRVSETCRLTTGGGLWFSVQPLQIMEILSQSGRLFRYE